MTVENPNMRRRAAAPATMAVAALALAGCATTHIGEDWQCPLEQGARCVSVAAADPAVRGVELAERDTVPAAVRTTGKRTEIGPPLPPVEAGRPDTTDTSAETDTTGVGRRCPAFCRPFRWFGRLLESDADREPADALIAGDSAADAGANADESPAAADAPAPDTDLRLPETIGRIWIAPYVDADGVYREAAWVRIVVAPAAWRTRR